MDQGSELVLSLSLSLSGNITENSLTYGVSIYKSDYIISL